MTIQTSTPQRIFISHSSKDDNFGQQLANDLLKALGDKASVWYDDRGGLKPGDSWTQAIEEALIACDVFIIIISPDAMESAWVRREFDIALSETKQILPVYYKACTIWPFLQTIQYVSFLPPHTYQGAFQELLMSRYLTIKFASALSKSSIDTNTIDVRHKSSLQWKPRIFIAYSHIDNDFGMRLAQDLRASAGDNSAVWSDVLGGLHGGETWWKKIVEELSACNVFLLVVSADSMNSQWVRREVDIALNENKYIIPILYRNTLIRADLKILQIISFLAPRPYEESYGQLIADLNAVLAT